MAPKVAVTVRVPELAQAGPMRFAVRRSNSGINDDQAAAQPGLTTVRQPFRRLGQKAVELLLAQIGGETLLDAKVMLPVELVVRGSVSSPAPSR